MKHSYVIDDSQCNGCGGGLGRSQGGGKIQKLKRLTNRYTALQAALGVHIRHVDDPETG